MKPLLDSLPSLRAVTFDRLPTWNTLELIFSYPRIVSITFHPGVSFAHIDPYPAQKLPPTPVSLTSLSYGSTIWKEWEERQRRGRPRDLREVFSQAAKSLSALVPATHATVVHLALPMQSAPLLSMAELCWPHLREFVLTGRYVDFDQADSLPVFLSSLPHLQVLSVLIARDDIISRAPILGQNPSPSTVLSGLRSLEVAYPATDDSIFSINTTHLRRLSLRDWPRHYTKFAYQRSYTNYWASPILNSEETLAVLHRMDLPKLTSLELAYEVQELRSDDDLLAYIGHTFPGLTYLELHRYRADREASLDHVR